MDCRASECWKSQRQRRLHLMTRIFPVNQLNGHTQGNLLRQDRGFAPRLVHVSAYHCQVVVEDERLGSIRLHLCKNFGFFGSWRVGSAIAEESAPRDATRTAPLKVQAVPAIAGLLGVETHDL